MNQAVLNSISKLPDEDWYIQSKICLLNLTQLDSCFVQNMTLNININMFKIWKDQLVSPALKIDSNSEIFYHTAVADE